VDEERLEREKNKDVTPGTPAPLDKEGDDVVMKVSFIKVDLPLGTGSPPM